MVAGHLRDKGGIYHIVLSYTDENGIRRSASRSTKLPVKGNKKRAEELLRKAEQEMGETLRYRMQAASSGMTIMPNDIRFTDFLRDWLKMMRSSVETVTCTAFGW